MTLPNAQDKSRAVTGPAVLVFMLLALWNLFDRTAVAGQKGENTPAPLPSGGSAVFYETMVDMTWPEVEKAAHEGAVVLMTTAVVEEHGPHMSCGIDIYLGYLMCRLTRRELESRGIRTVIAPPFFWGVNRTSHVFPGTFTARPETMKALLYDMLSSLKAMGFRDVFNINAHGDGLHIRTAIEAVIEARRDLELNVRYLMSKEDAKRSSLTERESFLLIHEAPPTGMESQEYLDLHAGAWETGVVAAFFPEQVNVQVAKTLEPTKVAASQIGDWVKDMEKITPLGYLGDPAGFDAAESKKYLEDSCRMVAEAIASSLHRRSHE